MKLPEMIDRFQIVGFALSAAISIGLLIDKKEGFPSITLGIVLAILTQLFDLQIRHSESEARVLQSNILGRALYRDEWLLKHIRQIVSDYESVKDRKFEWFDLRAQDAIVECRNVLHSMAEGFMPSDPRDRFDFGPEAFKLARESVKATVAGDLSFWRSTPGEKYFQANVDALKKVHITRVFIQPLDALREYVDILEKQRDAGIEVYIVRPEDISAELNEDYLIMDNRFCNRLELTGDRHSRGARISIDEVEVEQMVKRFDLLLRFARKLDDVIEELKQ